MDRSIKKTLLLCVAILFFSSHVYARQGLIVSAPTSEFFSQSSNSLSLRRHVDNLSYQTISVEGQMLVLKQQGVNNQLSVRLSGGVQQLAIIQGGEQNSLVLEQAGGRNVVQVEQQGSHQDIVLFQSGQGNYLEVLQTGTNNTIHYEGIGNGKIYSIRQSGENMSTIVREY